MLINKTNGKTLANNVKVCDNMILQATGAMFMPKLKDKALFFKFEIEQNNALHMMFVFQALDVLFLDKNMKIVEIKENFKPWRFYNPKQESQFVIELADGVIKNTGTKIGDIVEHKSALSNKL